MRTESRAVALKTRNSPASFGREILRPTAVQNVGKKLPGYCFGRLAHALWPRKPAAAIEYYTGSPERTSRQHASGKSDPGSAQLVAVIDSDQGWRALEWIMRDSAQPWWRELCRAKRCADAYEQQREQFEFDLR